MTKHKIIELELLRKGPPHNLLLSPLTEYLGLCGNFGATLVHVPWEHAAFMRRLSELRYVRPDELETDKSIKRQEEIGELAKDIARVLGASPGLAAGFADRDEVELTHLRMVVSAKELAMLPFELSKNIAGTPGGEENWLSVQTSNRICLTRRVRNVATRFEPWPTKPKILFVASSAGGKIPFKQHLQTLLKAIKPWLSPYDADDPQALLEESKKMMTVILNASIEDVDRACRKQAYTHVHILAHGKEDDKSVGNPFGLALRDETNPGKIDVVSGKRFSAALRPFGLHSGPAVVTVASCDSGNVNSVIYTGAGFAHDLHREGIPLVVASQFPLTFSGSITMTEVLYNGLLWGKHPLELLYELRRKLYAYKANDNHDWASLVVYETLPQDLEEKLHLTQYSQTRAASERIFERVDKLIDSAEETVQLNSIEDLHAELDATAERFPEIPRYRTEILGLRGSGEKRKAQAFYKYHQLVERQPTDKEALERCFNALARSQKFYSEALDEEMASRPEGKTLGSLHWLVTQYLALNTILQKPFELGLWFSARTSALTDIRLSNKDEVVWAHGTLAELYLIRSAYPKEKVSISIKEAEKQAVHHIGKITELVSEDDFPVISTRRQLRRYKYWWLNSDFKQFLDEKRQDRQDNVGIMEMNKLVEKLLILLTYE